jgi:histone chaperone ASF1
LNNPSTFFDKFQFEITFEVIAELQQDVEFRMVYVGSTQGPEYDQMLESVMVGPVPVGVSKFVLEAPAPKLDLIPQSDIVGLTVMLLSCYYLDKEFIRVGYYVNNDYIDEELRENPPAVPDLSKIQRSILAEKPRVSKINKVTRFAIPWDPVEPVMEEPKVVDEEMSQAMNIEI